MKRINLLLLFVLSFSLVKSFANDPQPIETTKHFAFYSNFWINMHHFLYNMTQALEKEKIGTPADYQIFIPLTNKEKKVVNRCIAYYQKEMIDKDLLFNGKMYDIKRYLIQFDEKGPLIKGEIDPVFVETANAFQKIYLKYYWKEHHAHNLKSLNQNVELLKTYEEAALSRLAELAQATWPEGLYRVDLTFYSNWAGAYTTNNPTHIVFGTQESGMAGDWIELIFHEASHSIISSRRGQVAELIKTASENLDKKPARNLWHSILFYLAGKVTQDLLAADNISYEIFMIRESIFDRHHEALIKYLDPYIKGEVSLEKAVSNLVKNL